ncbi:MAG TPA: zf-HC2 domain-containing protein [Candidatus Binataceae bacterium]|nr:zf-HC2 domain-containing protein [Candidatus Binataceae bacterium]
MDCNQVAELAPLYLSGELDRERSGAIDAHLRSCPSCMHELESQAHLDARMREVIAGEHVDASAVERWIRARISMETRSKIASMSPRPSAQPHRRRWIVGAATIAAVLLLAAVGYHGLMSPHVAPVYAAAAQDHQLEVVNHAPRSWLFDRAAISALAEGQGIASAVPFALSSGPYRLERAKLCFLGGRIFFHAVYTDGTREFSVYFRVRDAGPLPGTPHEIDNGHIVHASTLGAEQVASLQTKDLTIMVVADRYSGDALQVARFAAAAL